MGGTYLFEPRQGFREGRGGGADFLYALADDPAAPVRFDILDGDGAVIRTFDAAGRAGLNTARWDLPYDGPDQPELRTIPPDNPHIWERPFILLKDPAITTPDEDMAASTRTQIRIRDGIDRTVAMINQLEVMRKQIEDLEAAHADDAEALTALQGLDEKMWNGEMHFLSRTDVHSDDKWHVESYKVYMQYLWLSAEVGLGAGDVQGGAEHRPTAAALKWLEAVEKELAEGAEAFRRVVEEEVPAFNRQWAGRLPPIAPALIS